MKLATSPALLLLLSSGGSPVDSPTELRFEGRSEQAVEKTFEVSTAYALEEIQIEMGGRPVPEEYLPAMEMSYESALQCAWTDRVLELGANGKVKRSSRTFVELGAAHTFEMRIDGMDDSGEHEEVEGVLEGRSVVFDWEEDAGEYDCRMEQGDAPAEIQLDQLVEDTDFRAFLPAGQAELERGDSWEVDVEHGWTLVRPGGDLGLDSEDPTYRFTHEAGEIDGELLARYGGEREIAGRRIGVIEVEAELRFSIATRTTLERVPVADGMADETMHFSFEISGEILWDLAAGRFSAVDVEGDAGLRIETVKIRESDLDPAYSQKMFFGGDYVLRATAQDA